MQKIRGRPKDARLFRMTDHQEILSDGRWTSTSF